MLTVFLHTLLESFSRRTLIILLVVGLSVAALLPMLTSFYVDSEGRQVMVIGGSIELPAAEAARNLVIGMESFARTLWMFLVIFGVAPLLTSYMDRGWVELLLTKGVPRWQMILGRYLGALAVMVITLMVMPVLPALYLWIRTGNAPWALFGSLAVILVSFAAVTSTMALVSVAGGNPMVCVMIGYLELMASPALFGRKALQVFIPYEWIRHLLDWLYYLLPKHTELANLSASLLTPERAEVWWPLSTTVCYLLVMMGLSGLLLHRKSF